MVRPVGEAGWLRLADAPVHCYRHGLLLNSVMTERDIVFKNASGHSTLIVEKRYGTATLFLPQLPDARCTAT